MKIVQYDHKTMEKAVVDLWNECCTFDPITIQKFRNQALFDDNFNHELCLVALIEDEVVGFILATKRKFPFLEKGLEAHKAWINVLFVKEKYRRQKIAQKLLDQIEEKLLALGASEIILATYSPHYFFAGLDPEHYPEAIAFFEKNGYQSGSMHYSMGRDLHGYKMSLKTLEKKKMAEEKGYAFIPFDAKYSLELLDFLKDEFGASWKYNALCAMRQNNAEERIVLALNPEGKICGCANRAIDGSQERFGPIGIAESERNNGLGSILLEYALLQMSKKGIYHMYFMTTDEAGKRYYLRNGLSVIRTFVYYDKKIEKSVN